MVMGQTTSLLVTHEMTGICLGEKLGKPKIEFKALFKTTKIIDFKIDLSLFGI